MQLKEEFHVPDERVFHNKKSEVYFHAQGLQQFCSREQKKIFVSSSEYKRAASGQRNYC